MILLIIIVILFLICLIGGIYIVQQQHAYIIERLGKYHTITSAGIHVRIPIIDHIAAKIDLKTHQLTFPMDAKTKDNVTITLQISAQYLVDTTEGALGIQRSFYSLSSPIEQMRSYLIDALRSSVPKYDLDEVFDRKDSIASDVNISVSQIMKEYGFLLTSTLITAIELPRDVEESMNQINSAQRQKIAAQDLAEAERIRMVTEAKAKAEAMEQSGKGIAAQRKAIAEGIAGSLEIIQKAGLSEKEANSLLLFTQWIDMMESYAEQGRSSTVVLPADFNQSYSMFEHMLVASESTDARPVSSAPVPAARQKMPQQKIQPAVRR